MVTLSGNLRLHSGMLCKQRNYCTAAVIEREKMMLFLGGLLSMLLALIIMQLFYTTTVTTHIARTLQVSS